MVFEAKNPLTLSRTSRTQSFDLELALYRSFFHLRPRIRSQLDASQCCTINHFQPPADQLHSGAERVEEAEGLGSPGLQADEPDATNRQPGLFLHGLASADADSGRYQRLEPPDLLDSACSAFFTH